MRKSLSLAIALILTLAFASVVVHAQQSWQQERDYSKNPITVINNSGLNQLFLVHAYNVDDPFRLVSCQSLSLDNHWTKSGTIMPWKVHWTNVHKFHHCGNYDALYIYIEFVPSEPGFLEHVKTYSRVRWGATITINSKTNVVCSGC